MFTQRELDNYAGPVYRRGLEEGVKKGLEEGAARSRMEIARAMLALGLERDIICKSTGLTEDEIMRLGSE